MIIRGYKYVISGLLTCISLLLLAGCQEETVNGMSASEGRLVIAGLKVDVGVEDVATRSELTNAPSLSDLTIKLTDKNDGNNVIEIPASTQDTVVPVGSYTLSASYGENVCGTTPYFYGSTDVEIQSLGSTTATLSASLQSAIVHPIISESLQQQFKSFTLHVKCENADHATIAVANAADYFVPSGKSYTLSLAGTNQIGESKDIDVYTLNSATAATRYNITCDPTLPSFTMPTQAETNAWSTFINITPMTTSDISSLAGLTADKIISNAVYEASANGTDWTTSTKDASGNYKISGLKAGTTYTLRSRFGGVVSSNTVTFTTENGTELENGDMETYSTTNLHNTYYRGTNDGEPVNLYEYTGWITRNQTTTDGASSTSQTNGNVCVYYRWHSGTVPTSSSKDGSKAAELTTQALYTENVGSLTWSSGRTNLKKAIISKHNVYAAILSLSSSSSGISHDSRPTKLSFDYKYTSVDGDEAGITAIVYDSSGNALAEIDSKNLNKGESGWITQEVDFVYTNTNTKAASIYISFQSGTDSPNVSNLNYTNGGYDATPYSEDRLIGSVLTIDNVKLIYE
jgi:hypothetical protein